jgi:DNA-binding transcriptional ArsR family regulator
MVHTTALAEIGALIGDAGRANMLAALLDGRALTATELAHHAGVTPQTASGHLAKLLAGHLIVVEKQGRHRFHRLASPEVARMIEAMMQMAALGDATGRSKPVRVGPRDEALRAARTCYDHLAGRLGVAVADALAARDLIRLGADGGVVTPEGRAFLSAFGVDVEAALQNKRVFCRPCLDWSERRPHLAGVVGMEIMNRCFHLGWIRRQEGVRAVAVTPAGQQGFQRVFGVRHV